MHLPLLKTGKAAVETQDYFLGLNHNYRLRPGELYDMENLSSDLLPVLSTRQRRSVVIPEGNFQGLAARDGLCYVEGNALYVNGRKTDLRLSGDPGLPPRQLISMGAYLIVLPDKKYYNTADPSDYGSMEAEVRTGAPVYLCQCRLDGTEIRPSFLGETTPENPPDNSYWLNYERRELKQFSSATGLWVLLETPYVKLQCPGISKGFRTYDGVRISGDPGLEELSGDHILYECGEDFVIIPGILRESRTLQLPVMLERKVPDMDFCIECGNRLWGCRYGPGGDGQAVNEIYCSKLGDFRNFSCYLGISTDSYTVSLGSEGPFTGAVSYGGYPLFFKENCLHKVFGTMPSNFTVQTTPCRGVRRDCSRSLAICREVLYYMSPEGVCAYDGSLPREISRDLGRESFSRAVAGSLGNKYYISMEGEEGWGLYVYDTDKNLWHREDGLQAKFFCTCRQDLFCVDSRGRLLSMTGRTGEKEPEDLPFMLQSGIIGVTLPGSKYLSRLSFRMLLEPGSQVTVKVQYDSRGPFESLGTVRGMSLQSFVFPVVPRRCDHLRLRLEGKGRALLFSVTRIIKPGSDHIS